MFFAKIWNIVSQWLKSRYRQWRIEMRLTALIKEIVSGHFSNATLIEWKSAGDSHVIAHATTGRLWKQHHLCVIDIDFECLVNHREFSSIEQWSILLEAGAMRIMICHSLRSLRFDACSFWRFCLHSNQWDEDFGARLKFLATLDR